MFVYFVNFKLFCVSCTLGLHIFVAEKGERTALRGENRSFLFKTVLKSNPHLQAALYIRWFCITERECTAEPGGPDAQVWDRAGSYAPRIQAALHADCSSGRGCSRQECSCHPTSVSPPETSVLWTQSQPKMYVLLLKSITFLRFKIFCCVDFRVWLGTPIQARNFGIEICLELSLSVCVLIF